MLNPEESQDEDDNVVVTDDSKEEPLGEAEVLGRRREGGRSCGGRWGGVTHSHPQDKSSDDEDNKGDKNSESEEESDGEESDEAERDGDVDQGFREQLMAVLQAGKALVSGSGPGPSVCLGLSLPACDQAAHGASVPKGGGDGEDDDDDEELGDEAMMALDENLASLFAEQKLRIQARREEKNKLQKEKALRRDFQIRVRSLSPPAPAPAPTPRLAEPTRPAAGPGPDRGAGDQAAREPPGLGAARAAAAHHPAQHAHQQRQAGAGPAAQDGPHLHVSTGLPGSRGGSRISERAPVTREL